MQVTAIELGHAFDSESPLFTGLDFTLRANELVALTGPSGSGKSTLLSILARWEQPSSGHVDWVDIETVGWVFQNPFGVPGRTVLDHVSLPLLAKGLRRNAADEQAREILAKFGLEQHLTKPYATLSGGEAQRLMLSRAVAKGPSLLLVDEPTAGLDRRAAETVNEVLSSLAQANTIVVVATHDSDTRDACDENIDLSRGPVKTQDAG